MDHKTIRSAEVYAIKTKCKTIAQTSQHNLRQIFNDVRDQIPQLLKSHLKNANRECFGEEKYYNL